MPSTSGKVVIGCDPGAKGAMCAIYTFSDSAPVTQFIDNGEPVTDILYWLRMQLPHDEPKHIMLEDVHSLFGMSAKSNFNFGKNLGIVETLLLLQGSPLKIVQPKIWQKAVGVDVPSNIKGPARSKAIKAEVARLCEVHYPGCKIWGKRGGLMDGRSDALMIAHYCLMQLKGT